MNYSYLPIVIGQRNDLGWLIIVAATLELSYQTKHKDFNEHHVDHFLLQDGISYAPSTIRKALNSLCLKGICERITCYDRREKRYRFDESLEFHNIFKNAFKF